MINEKLQWLIKEYSYLLEQFRYCEIGDEREHFEDTIEWVRCLNVINDAESFLNNVQLLKETERQIILRGYEWWEYGISRKENDRLFKKYYPNEKTGYPRFFMDTDKARIYCLENGIEVPPYLLNSDQNVQVSDTTEAK